MKAVILAGSKGEELLPLTDNTPKPVVHVANIPFIFYQLDRLKQAGIKEVILSLRYLPRRIQDILGDGANYGMVIRYAVEDVPLGTAGALRNATDLIDDTVLVLNGDILTTIDLKQVVARHRSCGSPITIVCGQSSKPFHFGYVNYDEKFHVTDFTEKPQGKNCMHGQSNVGIYVFNTEALEQIPLDTPCTLERDIFPHCIDNGMPIQAYCTDEYWLDIGALSSYLQANLDVITGLIPLPTFYGLFEHRAFPAPEGAEIDDKSFVDSSCIIKAGASLSECILGANCRIEEGARLHGCVLLQGARVKKGAELRYCVLGKSCVIGESVKGLKGAVFGDKSTISDFSTF